MLRLIVIASFVLGGACSPLVEPVSQVPITADASLALTVTPIRSVDPAVTAQRPSTQLPAIDTPDAPALPRSERNWISGPVLIVLGHRPPTDDGKELYPHDLDMNIPSLVLYADGMLIVTTVENARITSWTKQLSRQKVCSLLYAIEQAGFFQVPTPAQPSAEQWGLIIQVSAWQSSTVEFDGSKDVSLAPSIGNTFQLLKNYRPADMHIYQPNRVAVWVTVQAIPKDPSAPTWLFETPSLAQLFKAESGNPKNPAYILNGEDARALSDALGSIGDGYFTEGAFSYRVLSRALLPYEEPPDPMTHLSALPSPEYANETFQHTCKPSDGAIEIPKP